MCPRSLTPNVALALRADYEDRVLWRHVLFSLHSSYSAETLLLGVLHCFY